MWSCVWRVSGAVVTVLVSAAEWASSGEQLLALLSHPARLAQVLRRPVGYCSRLNPGPGCLEDGVRLALALGCSFSSGPQSH